MLGCVILISLPFCFMNATYYCYALQIVHKSSFIIILLLLNRRALSNLTWHSPMMPKKAPLHYNYGHARYIFRYPHASHISSTLLLACHPPPVLLPSLLFRLLSPPLSFFLPTTYPTHRPPIPAHPLGLHNNRSASTSKAPRHVPTLFFPHPFTCHEKDASFVYLVSFNLFLYPTRPIKTSLYHFPSSADFLA